MGFSLFFSFSFSLFFTWGSCSISSSSILIIFIMSISAFLACCLSFSIVSLIIVFVSEFSSNPLKKIFLHLFCLFWFVNCSLHSLQNHLSPDLFFFIILNGTVVLSYFTHYTLPIWFGLPMNYVPTFTILGIFCHSVF